MADCSYARCMQERRTIKKHLQKWTKNCIYTLGFERVAEEFMGRRKWRLYQERVLRSWCPSIEREIEIKDWDPSEDKCSFCDLDTTGKATEEVPASPLRSECCVTVGHNNNIGNHIEALEGDESDSDSISSVEESIPTMNALDSVTACQAAIAALAGAGGAPNPLLYPPGVFPNWYLTQSPKALLEGIAKTESPMMMNLPASSTSEMPLDLSAKSSKPPPVESPDNMRLPNIIDNKPMIKGRSRMSPMSGRRAYTEDELQAALRDIQSGKLGTRRAAVIYGIPRSTLRNKVYKLALERERDAHLLLAPRPSPPEGATSSPSLPVNAEKEDSSADDEKESECAKPQFSMENLLRLSAAENLAQTEGLAELLHNISRLHAEGINTKEMLASENSLLGSYLTQLLKLKENVSPESEKDVGTKNDEAGNAKEGEEAAKEADETSQDSGDRGKYSSQLIPNLMRQIMAERRLLIEEQLKRKMAGENGVDDDQSNVILRIPSFKPNASCSKSVASDPEAGYSTSPAGASQENSRQSAISPSLNGDSDSPPADKAIGIANLRDAIVKGIGQKFHQEGIGHIPTPPAIAQGSMDALAKRGGFSHLSLPPQHSVLKNHFERNQQRSHHANVQTNSQGKGTRPKRGKYRNYDRDSLVEAVRAVQRGEMSVHRAGSYYGVPHSTLEYKVKERHLMRPRKREPKGEDKAKLTSSSSSSSGGGSGGPAAASSEKSKPLPLAPKPTASKPSFPNPAALANGLKIPPGIFETGVSPLAAYAGAPFPFWPPTPFHPLPLDISRGAFSSAPEQLFAPQIIRGGAEPPPSPSTLPRNTRRIAESLYDGSGNNGSFLDGIIRSSLEMGLNTSQKHDKESEKSGKNTEQMSNKALLEQLCRNSRLTPVPKPSGESNSDEEFAPRNVPYDLSRSSDDDVEDAKSKKRSRTVEIYKQSFGIDRRSSERDSRDEESGKASEEERCKKAGDEKTAEKSGNRSEGRPCSPEENRPGALSDDEGNARSPNAPENADEDMEGVSNHASDDREDANHS